MATVGRIKGDDLQLSGEFNEVTPVKEKNLVANFPFDESEVGKKFNRSLLDKNEWTLGTNGSQGSFGKNGSTSENEIIIKENPWGDDDKIWATLGNDSTSNSDGGWNTSNITIDNTKTYRLSVWIRREDVGDGRTYFGCQGGKVSNLGSSTANGNPYFTSRLISDIPEMENNWLLWVAFIHPHTYSGGTHPDSGIYMLDGTKLEGIGNYKWMADATVGGHRTYLYYSTTTDEKQFWDRPRMEVLDGTEASIDELLMGVEEDVLKPTSTKSLNFNYYGVALEEGTTNLVSSDFAKAKSNGGYAMNKHSSYTYQFLRNVDGREDVLYVEHDGTDWHDFYPTKHDIFQTQVGDFYTLSYEYKVIEGSDTPDNPILYHDGWKSPSEDQSATRTFLFDIDIGNGWRKRAYKFEITYAGSAVFRFSAGYTDLKWKYYMDNIQFEKKPFPTSFVDGTRSQNGNIDIPVDLGQDFTLFYKYTPNHDWTEHPTIPYNRRMWSLYDKNTGKSVFHNEYVSSLGQTEGNPWIGFDNFVTSDYSGAWHWHTSSQKNYAGVQYWFALVKEGAEWTKYLYDDDGLTVASTTHTNQELIDFHTDRMVLEHNYNWTVRDLSFYDSALPQEDIVKLASAKFGVGKDGSVKGFSLNEDEHGWKLVWQGLASMSRHPQVENDDEVIDVYGDEIQFNQMKITCPVWDYQIVESTNKTAVLKNSFTWYSEWVGDQPDENSPQVKFHGVDDVQDVVFSTPYRILFGYGNSWRRITPVHYVSGSANMYLGAVPNYINKIEWDRYHEPSQYDENGDPIQSHNPDYQSNMDKNYPRESGRFSLTPREFNMVQVWVRMNPNEDESKKMKVKRDKIELRGQIFEGVNLDI